jgi:S-layer family protein
VKTQTRTIRFVRMVVATTIVWTLAIALPAGAVERTPTIGDLNDVAEISSTTQPMSPLDLVGSDYSVTVLPRPEDWVDSPQDDSQAPLAYSDDPLGIVAKAPFVRRYSLDTDYWQVYLCGNTSVGMTQAVKILNGNTADYYSSWSQGSLQLSFSAGASLSDTDGDNCRSAAASSAASGTEGIFIIDTVTGGGFASPGSVCFSGDECSWVPSTVATGSGRYAVVGDTAFANYPQVVVHELGHSYHWPHSNSGSSEYDNPIDVMSGNAGTVEALSTLSYNRYLSGWIDPSDVFVTNGNYAEVTLQPGTSAGTQMIVVNAAKQWDLFVLGARTNSAYDPISPSMEGVEVYWVDHNTCTGWGGAEPCPSLWREQIMEPARSNSLDHVYQVGESFTIEGMQFEVTGRSGEGFTIAVGDPNAPVQSFVDTSASQFIADIEWLLAEGITSGCNPPTNDRFCPNDDVTRGQMAAFLSRALNLTDPGTKDFVDDDTSAFEADIERLAAAGITQGCNPPDNDQFCPDDPVTREQMAAFLVRALGLTDVGTIDFVDDDFSIFENDIEKLATAGITLGCNPPDNDQFCPTNIVTREQMAAFLHRALTP